VASRSGVRAPEGHHGMIRKFQSGLRRWREVKRRPVQGNSPNDRILRGPDCNRPKRVYADSFPVTPSPQPPTTRTVIGVRFLGMTESFAPMWSLSPLNPGRYAAFRAALGPGIGRDGRSAPCSSFAMSSGRLILDRVARQHCPSPLHRRAQTNMHFSPTGENRTFLLCRE